MEKRYHNINHQIKMATAQEIKLLRAIYDGEKYRTREDLNVLMNRELEDLIDLKSQINKISKAAVLEGMRQDGVEYPGILWAEEIEMEVQNFLLTSLRQQMPVAKLPEIFSKQVESLEKKPKRTVIYVLTTAGVIMAITGFVANPVNLLMLTLGLVLTVTGVVLFVKEVYFDKSALDCGKPDIRTEAETSDVSGYVAELLEKQIMDNEKIIRKWNRALYMLAEKAMDCKREEELV